MKIIGKANDGLIVKISFSEAANLIGHYSEYSDGNGVRSLQEGDEIQVHAMYRQLYNLHDQRNNVSEAAQQLRALASLLEAHDPVVRKIVDGQDANADVSAVDPVSEALP